MQALVIGVAALVGTVGLAAATPAAAQANVMKDCAAKYQAAKASNALPAGQTWIQYLAQCRGTAKTAAPVPAAAASTAKTTAVHTVTTQKTTATNVPVAKGSGTRTAGQIAWSARQKQCGAQWQADKAAGKTGSQTWPQYLSACSKRLKG